MGDCYGDQTSMNEGSRLGKDTTACASSGPDFCANDSLDSELVQKKKVDWVV